MDIDILKAFLTVADTGSFSMAANKLFLTQPAISKRILRLEEELNHKLFDRLGKELRLTEAGSLLLPKARGILHEVEQTSCLIRELSGEIVGTLNVATSHHIGLHHLPPILKEFASTHPTVNLKFEFLDSEKAHTKVLNGECELAIVTVDPNIQSPLTAEIIWQDELIATVANTHRLAQHKNSMTLEKLSKEAAILPDLSTYTGRIVKQAFDQEYLDLNVNMSTNYLETIKMIVSVGLGWSVLPAALIDQHMCCLNVKNMHLTRDLGIVRHKKRSLSNAANAFLKIIYRKLSLS